ncbi:hypothetical protein GRAN_1982 [Granulicella sibirica]|uniref:Uncharacterized protein n=1 Tax=Granulicella sibirica TaxID=2479048 RepID=A0A4Q0T6P1_9BACT|nr:hypothetical protein GRAN_1982 [Granulicella sibirica]
MGRGHRRCLSCIAGRRRREGRHGNRPLRLSIEPRPGKNARCWQQERLSAHRYAMRGNSLRARDFNIRQQWS